MSKMDDRNVSKPYRSNDLRKLLKLPEINNALSKNVELPAVYAYIDKFQSLGNTFSFIIDFSTMKYLYVSKSTAQITGHKNWKKGGVEFAMSLYHPNDESAAREIHKKKITHCFSVPPNERGRYKYTHDFRIRHANGKYIRINHHAVHIKFDTLGNPINCLCICTDITDLKKSTTINLEISKLDETENYVTEFKEYYPLSGKLEMSSREFEVLSFIADGVSNKEIAKKMFISEHTVRDHRKNMLNKNHAKNIAELISLAWQERMF